jgi:hypothetical protein
MIHVITVATHNEGYFDALKQSCKNNNINLVVLGFNEKWQGFTWRFTLIKNYIKNINDDDIILFIDAFDIIIIDKIEEIERRFKEFNKPIIIGYENSNYFQTYIYGKIFGKSDYTLNAGTYIGYKYAIEKLFYVIKDKYINLTEEEFNLLDDQQILVNLCYDKPEFINDYITFDKNSSIFYICKINNINNILTFIFKDYFFDYDNFYYIQNDKLFLKNENKKPCIIHGVVNTDMDKYITLYNLPNKIDRSDYNIKACIQFIPLIMNNSKIELFIIILILIVIIYKIFA